jgi:hypothetical protein
LLTDNFCAFCECIIAKIYLLLRTFCSNSSVFIFSKFGNSQPGILAEQVSGGQYPQIFGPPALPDGLQAWPLAVSSIIIQLQPAGDF